MSIISLLEEVKNTYQKAKSPFFICREKKDEISNSLLEQLKIEQKEGRLNFIDENHNNLLHLIFQIPQPDIDCTKFILDNVPYLLSEKNIFGQTPYDILWFTEAHTHYSNRLLKALLCQYMESSQAKNILDQQCNISLLERFFVSEKEFAPHYDYITENRFDNLFNRPTLLCFPGKYAFNAKEANGLIKFIRKTLNIDTISTPKIQTLSAWYPGNSLDLCCDLYAFMSPYIHYEEDNPFKYCRRFVKRYMRPLYMQKNKTKMPILQAMKNIRMLNFFGYSYGASIIQMISNELTKDMQECGFSKKEIASIQSQICVLTIGYFGNINNYKNFFSSHHLLHTQDRASYDTLSAVIEKKGFSRQAFYISTLKHQPNQRIFITNGLNFEITQDPHNIKTYFDTEKTDERNILINLWKECILINALNNSVQNSEQSDFEQLPSKLNFIPQEVKYVNPEGENTILNYLNQQAKSITTTRWKTVSKHKNQFALEITEKIR